VRAAVFLKMRMKLLSEDTVSERDMRE